MSRTNKLHFIEAMLNWFASPSMGRELDVKFLSDTYDDITAPAWVSVEERLPEENEEVLAYNAENEEVIACDYHHKMFHCWPEAFNESISHWMLLPTPPVKKGGK